MDKYQKLLRPDYPIIFLQMNVTREPRFGVFLCPKIIYKDMIKVFEEFEYSIADAMRMDSILEFLDDIKDDRLKKLKKINKQPWYKINK